MRWYEPKMEPHPRGLPADRSAAALKILLEGPSRCDARTLWGCATGFRGYSEPPATTAFWVPVAVEIDPKASDRDRTEIAQLVVPRGIYNVVDPQADRFWTGLICNERFADLSMHPHVLGWRVGVPDIPWLGSQPSGGDTNDATALGPLPDRSIKESAPVTIGIIDHGIAIAHRSFRVPRGIATRIVHLWDQDPQRLLPANNQHECWKPVRGLGYGGEIGRETLNDLITQRAATDERGVYEHLQYRLPLASVCHGTHVLDLAAGWPDPLASDTVSDPDEASKANIVAVQLPYLPAKDTSGSALCVHVLDALHYIVRRAPAGNRVVINLSDGAYGGPHDGGSMLERAIDDFLARHPWVTLVLAAGNAHEDRGHARASLACAAPVEFRWRVLPDDSTDSFLEVWLDDVYPHHSIQCTVTPPGNAASVTVQLGDASVLVPSASDVVIGAVFSRLSCPDGRRRSMFLLAIAPTRWREPTREPAPHGVWRLKVENVGAHDGVQVDAWIERDNPVFNENGPRRQSYFEDNGVGPAQVESGQTLGSLCGSAQAIVVGGCYRRGKAFSGHSPETSALTQVARYSSRGPSRAGDVMGPDLIAPSDESPVLHGLRAAANRSGATFRMDGTSVAAPIVTRRIVNLLRSAARPRGISSFDRAAIERWLVPNPQPDPQAAGQRGSFDPAVATPCRS